MQRALILSVLAVLSALDVRIDAAMAQVPAAAVGAATAAAVAQSSDSPGGYQVQPGDILTVTVWKETDLTGDLLVRPDFGLSFPLVGDLDARGKTVEQLRVEITERLKKYIPSPVVTVATKAVAGNHIYVVGKVQRPGEYPVVRNVDVMQALSLAGGATPFAALNDIIVLRRESAGQNVLLQPGDTVVVP
jgi:polysaccharide export outer membrane protein